jgi:hypothetical protein
MKKSPDIAWSANKITLFDPSLYGIGVESDSNVSHVETPTVAPPATGQRLQLSELTHISKGLSSEV